MLAGTFVHCYFYVYDSDLFYVTAIHTFCDYQCSDSVQLGACQILRFHILSVRVEAHWLRLPRIWNRLHRIFCVTYLSDMYEYKHDTSTLLIRVQFIVQPSLELSLIHI